MKNDKPILDTESANQAVKEEKVLDLLEEFDRITLTDGFNKNILARIKEEEKQSSYHWYKPFAALAASIIIAIAIYNFQKSPTDDHPLPKIASADIAVIANMDLLDKMEIFEHLDVFVDMESTQKFLQLL
jgi:hypothetical protein